MGWTTRVPVPGKNKLAVLLLEAHPKNVWKQSDARHNSLLKHELDACWGEMCGMVYCAARANLHASHVLVLQECTMKVQEGKFKLQDLLVVPMQRVLKYHLLLKVGPTS